MQKNKWSQNFDWIKSGDVYIQQSRLEKYDENRFIAVGDIYFKLNKYLTGVTFTYINSLQDIYKRDLLTGDGYSIVNMYNEYDIIDSAFKNVKIVDVASENYIDINKQWYEINSAKLKPGHTILLFNQQQVSGNEYQNGIYVVTNNYFLKPSDFLSNREKSYKFSCSIKLGKNANRQYYLDNNGLDFPTTFEPKYFREGQSFLLKNLIRYNMYNTFTGITSESNTSKMIFTDFDFARKQIKENSGKYYDLTIDVPTLSQPSIYLTINYHHDSYSILSGTSSGITFTGLTSTIRNSITGTTIIDGSPYKTKFETSCIPFPSNFEFKVGDHILLNMYSGTSTGTTLLRFDSYIKTVQDNYLVLEETIPNRILNELKNSNFIVNNLNVASDWFDAIYKMSQTPYSDYYSISTQEYFIDVIQFIYLKLSPVDNVYNKYFDYCDLEFLFNDNSFDKYFLTDNQYLKYNLYDRLNEINSSIFNTGFLFFNTYLLSGFSYNYIDGYKRIKLYNLPVGASSYFRPYTYVDVTGTSGVTQKTLVYEVYTNEIIIEKPANWNSTEVLSIQNIDGLKNISDILFEVYINDKYDWYIQKNDNERKYIAKTYAELLTQNKLFRDNVTGILFENDNNEFILKLYDLGKSLGGTDKNLEKFSAIELVYLGADRKTRLPVPLKSIESYTGTTELDWNVLDDGLNDSLSGIKPLSSIIGDYFDFGYNVVLPGPNNPPLLYNLVDGGLDSVLS